MHCGPVLDVTPHRSRLLHFVLSESEFIKYHGLVENQFLEPVEYRNVFTFPLVVFNIYYVNALRIEYSSFILYDLSGWFSINI